MRSSDEIKHQMFVFKNDLNRLASLEKEAKDSDKMFYHMSILQVNEKINLLKWVLKEEK